MQTWGTICWRGAAATQFALYMAFGNIGTSVGAAVAGPLDVVLDYTHLFFVLALLSFLLLPLLRKLDLEGHRVYQMRTNRLRSCTNRQIALRSF